MKLSLRARIHFLFAAIVIGLGVALGVVFTLLSSAEVGRQVREDTYAASRLFSIQLLERQGQLRRQMVLISELPTLKSLVCSKTDRQTGDDWVRSYISKTDADAIIITGANGQPLGENSLYGNQFSAEDLPGVGIALEGKDWSGVIGRDQTPLVGTTIPLRNGGVVIGTMTALKAIDSRTATDFREAVGTNIMFVSNRRVIGSSVASPIFLDELPVKPTRMTFGHKSYMAMFEPFYRNTPFHGLGFISLQEYDKTAGPFRELSYAFIGALLLALLIAGFTARRIATTVTEPLDDVVAAATALQQGEWPEPMTVKSHDEIGFLQSVFNEMTMALRKSSERLVAMIDLDPTTELYNHTRFLEKLDELATRFTAESRDLSMLLLDIDDFSKYNLNAGHAAGDEIIQRVSNAMKQLAPENAILARYGGEEFAVVLPDVAQNKAEVIAEDLRLEIKRLCAPEGLTVSLGCAKLDSSIQTASGLVLAAEIALSQAKQLGKDQVCSSGDEHTTPQQLNELSTGNLATIQALAAAVDAKDSYTQGHSERVAQYALELARYVGVDDDEATLIFLTGTLHDVGKIGVPDAILQKPRRLTPEEFAIMQTHPALGEVIVRKVPELAPTLPGVRHHHERWDGAGYPDGIQGEDIPRVARFLAIADTFDAMTTDRPYRRGMSADEAIDEIERCAGSQFDPELALAFGRMMRRKYQQAA